MLKALSLSLVPPLILLGPALAGVQDGDGETDGPPGQQLQEADYVALSSHIKEFTNFNIETVRGMVWNPNRSRLYAINTHGSRLLYHVDNDPAPDGQWTTIHNPVALDIWAHSGSYDLIVAGGATHAVARHDPATGAILDLLNVPSEPGDLVVTPDGRAWVSCRGADVVVEIDLATFQILNEYAIPSERPRFLSWHSDASVPAGYRVFVAPMVSGNNTRNVKFLGGGGAAAGTSEVRSLPLDDPATAVLEGLPDEDLFEMIPGTGTVNPLVKGLGSLILEHVKHPTRNEMWVLSIVAKNADLSRQTEPGLESDFADNALTLVPLPAQGAVPIQAPAYIDLDNTNPNPGAPPTYSAATSGSFPFATAIDDVTGLAFVACSTSDRLLVLNSSGQRIWQRDLPQGSIPRDILIDRATNTLGIYLWGTNELYMLALDFIWGPELILDLGNDPTPETIAEGREHWYDADNSLFGRNTCNTCHPGGGSDFLGWALTEPPFDRKDAMVTQSLKSIEDTFPYHWRGERQLRDFNRLAFPGLLGGTALTEGTGGTFEEFKEFAFSLQVPRNPHQDWKRVVSDFVAPPGVFPTSGQQVFENQEGLFGGFTCAECHSQPTGTNGSISFDNGDAAGFTSNANMDVAHLRQLFNKDGGLIEVMLNGVATPLPRLGWGLAHSGVNGDIFDFVDPETFVLTDQQRLDVAEFVNQWDQGIAPVAQLGWQADAITDVDSILAVLDLLVPQAANGWIDMIAFGTVQDLNGQQVFTRWLWDPASSTFEANDSAVVLPNQLPGVATLPDFLNQFSAGTASLTFLGVPPGNGYRLALDPDNDRLTDGEELTTMFGATDPENWDSDGDLEGDGFEANNGGDPLDDTTQANDTTPPVFQASDLIPLGVSTSTATYGLRFSEPVSYTITYSRPGEPAITRSRIDKVMEDTITLQEMRASSVGATVAGFVVPSVNSQYTLSMVIEDEGGNSVTYPLTDMPVMEHAIEPLLEPNTNSFWLTRVISSLGLNTTRMGSTLSCVVNANVEMMHEGLNIGVPGLASFRANQRVVAQVLKDTGSGWEVVPLAEIASSNGQQNYEFKSNTMSGVNTEQGPLTDVLISNPTGVGGNTTINFDVLNLNPGDRVRYNVIGIYEDFAPGTAINEFSALSLVSWLMPLSEDDPQVNGTTITSQRGVETTF